ncbi:unnamed protein product, partial [Ectocarpus fasciculatus]
VARLLYRVLALVCPALLDINARPTKEQTDNTNSSHVPVAHCVPDRAIATAMPASQGEDRSRLYGFELEIFKLVRKKATSEQWREWLRAPLEHAAAEGNM